MQKRTKQYARSMLGGLVRSLELNPSLVNTARQDPWNVYETLKERYCNDVRSIGEYNDRIEEIVFGLGV